MVAIKWGRGMSNAVDHRITSGTLVIESKGLLPFAFNTFKENKNKFVIFLKRKLKEQKRELRFAIGFGPPSQIFHRVPVFFFLLLLFCFVHFLFGFETHPPTEFNFHTRQHRMIPVFAPGLSYPRTKCDCCRTAKKKVVPLLTAIILLVLYGSNRVPHWIYYRGSLRTQKNCVHYSTRHRWRQNSLPFPTSFY